ncbi:flagellar protein FlaG [Pigmentiphaga humi]|uniref:Flagellar protein FlaG n=1 Tax=Pigmentiphaga humi TaxID=2478468 RepID=A0A3P4B309_9BURK|nr:flagellar protein FlaG [Pigmentiphaga humi]VCU69926.1 flagellar protein FlaG [Pigmentiphaga humi]
MSINAIGTPVDLRASSGSAASPAQPLTPAGAGSRLDPSLPATAQVHEAGELQAAVDTFNRFIPLATHNLTFSIDEDSGKVVVKILDGDTQDVIRQIPSEEALALSRSLDQIKGVLLNGKA